MDDLLLRASYGDDVDVWISEVSKNTFDANELDDLGTDFGYFLMAGKKTGNHEGVRILAKLASEQAALELFAMLTSRTRRCTEVNALPQDENHECEVTELFPFGHRKPTGSLFVRRRKARK